MVNPSWAVNSGDGEFNNVLTVLSGATSTTLPSKVGYRGFLVSATVSGGTTVMYTFGQGQQSSTTLETTLLNTNNGALSSDVFNIALAGINGLVSCLTFLQLAFIYDFQVRIQDFWKGVS